jgi:hypothetical protein
VLEYITPFHVYPNLNNATFSFQFKAVCMNLCVKYAGKLEKCLHVTAVLVFNIFEPMCSI